MNLRFRAHGTSGRYRVSARVLESDNDRELASITSFPADPLFYR